jgi:hypothetical protein
MTDQPERLILGEWGCDEGVTPIDDMRSQARGAAAQEARKPENICGAAERFGALCMLDKGHEGNHRDPGDADPQLGPHEWPQAPEVRSKPCTFKGCGASEDADRHNSCKGRDCPWAGGVGPQLGCHPYQDTDDSGHDEYLEGDLAVYEELSGASLRSVAVAKEERQ